MKIGEIFKNIVINKVENYSEIDITGISIDSRTLQKGDVFICLSGENFDGHNFVETARAKGASCVVAEREIDCDLPIFYVKNTRYVFSIICANFYGNPADSLNIITVVGTNGKTSTVKLLSDIFEFAGYKTATIGTLGYYINGEHENGMLTTPDPLELQRKLAEIKEKGVDYVFMEASAHAIYYHKLAGIRAKASILTNITQDHLDFFKNMESYSQTKISYFSHRNTLMAMVNSDDDYAIKLLQNPRVPIITYGINNPADVFAINIKEDGEGLKFTLNAYDCIFDVKVHLFGLFNVYNLMASVATAMYFGISAKTIEKCFSVINPVKGRYNVQYVNNKKVIIDYAHTPDGLKNLLKDVKATTSGQVYLVFGCGGNRDKSKRKIMGEIASQYADNVTITNDNPRFEEEMAIANAIKEGIACDTLCNITLNRATAIKNALENMSVNDTLVIAGKGHEEYIDIKGEKIKYSDYQILQNLNMKVD